MMQTGVHLCGNGQAPVHKYWKHLMHLIQTGEINPLDMVTHRTRLEDMDKLYDVFSKREMGMQKVFVQTKHSGPVADGAPQLTDL
jgi:threonine dehydrogenase-like Zn-dependent dehydrogenase